MRKRISIGFGQSTRPDNSHIFDNEQLSAEMKKGLHSALEQSPEIYEDFAEIFEVRSVRTALNRCIQYFNSSPKKFREFEELAEGKDPSYEGDMHELLVEIKEFISNGSGYEDFIKKSKPKKIRDRSHEPA